ncbi:hypothetical protein BvCmsSINP010_02146 [Escherichia coli]|nr:hypothetical protein BvCmsSINP010_02146 [Escherichia coli]
MKRGIHFRCTGNNGYGIAPGAVQARAIDGDTAFSHLQRLQAAVGIHHRFARGERRVRRVDKTTAVTGDTIRVGNHHICRFAGHFRIALQQ